MFMLQVKKEILLDPEELQQFQNHSSQMAALDFIVSNASNIFIPTYDGNMARLVEGHRRCIRSTISVYTFLMCILNVFLNRSVAGIMVIRKPSYWIAKLW